MYDVSYGEATRYGRAYVLSARGRHTLYVGNVERLTAARKAYIVRHALEARGMSVPTGTDAELAAMFTRLPVWRADAMTVRPVTVVNLDDATDVRHGLDYTYATGGGELPATTELVNVP